MSLHYVNVTVMSSIFLLIELHYIMLELYYANEITLHYDVKLS